MDFIIFAVSASILFIFLFVNYVNYRRKYWAKRNVPSLKPSNFIMGSTADILLKRIPFYLYHENLYKQLAPHKFGGYYNLFTPVLILRDPELIKSVLTKDFNYFTNRSTEILKKNEPLSQHLFNLKSEEWRTLRAKLTPTFTSGKIKNMFNLMRECTEELQEMINSSIEKNESVDVKEMMARFTTDVISSCVFGLQANSQKDANSIFRIMGRKVFQQSPVVLLMSILIPKFREIFRIPFFKKEIGEFFRSLVTKTIAYREENGVARNDFLDLLIALKKREIVTHNLSNGVVNQVEFTDNLLTAQCFVFFIAGFETSSGALTYALFELAKNEKVQKNLVDEINQIIDKNGGSLTYECIQQMAYLDQVVCETLRMYPLLPILQRVCGENYQLDDRIIIEKNTRIVIPVRGLHYDPLYYENPNKFDPENFSAEARAKRHHFTFLPFGEGPRLCIGMRFGLMQVKLGLITLIRSYSVSLSPNMGETFNYHLLSFLPKAKGDVWLNFKKRSS